MRASWTDSLGEHSVYSDFAVAAVAVIAFFMLFFSCADGILGGIVKVFS